MLLLLLNHVVLRALCKIDVYLISTLVNKSLYFIFLYILFRLIKSAISPQMMFVFTYGNTYICNLSEHYLGRFNRS